MSDNPTNVQVCLILGTTASGKSLYAYEWAKKLSCDIISADAYQIYSEMSIGTAKPEKYLRENVKHHLIDCLSVKNPCDVAWFVKEAESKIEECLKKQEHVLITGGTNYYIYTLLEGLYQVPSSNLILRQKWLDWALIHGDEALWKEAQRIDPVSAERIHCHDTKRLIRVLEVFESTRQPLSSFQRERGIQMKWSCHKIGLRLSDKCLSDRIEKRVHTMIERGFLSEVEDLVNMDCCETSPFQTALGYKEAKSVLDGNMSLDELIVFLIKQTKKLARKQMKWLKRDKDIQWIDPLSGERLALL